MSTTIELEIQGMTCEHCVKRATKALQAVPCVSAVQVTSNRECQGQRYFRQWRVDQSGGDGRLQSGAQIAGRISCQAPIAAATGQAAIDVPRQWCGRKI